MKYTSFFYKLLLATTLAGALSVAQAASSRKGTSRNNTTSSKAAKPAASTTQEDANASVEQTCEEKGQPQPSCVAANQIWSEASCSCISRPTSNSATRCDNGTVVSEQITSECKFDPHTCRCIGEAEPTTNSVQSSASCAAEFRQMFQTCEAQTTSASTKCDNDQDSGIQTAKDTLSEFTVGIGSAIAAQKPCAGIAKYVGLLNGAVAGFAELCNSARSTCVDTCRAAKVALEGPKGRDCFPNPDTNYAYRQLTKDTKEQYTTCTGLAVKVSQAKAAVTNIANTVRAAQSCSVQTAAAPTDYCIMNPTAPTCVIAAKECADPTIAATNPICYCNTANAASNPNCRNVMRNASNTELVANTPTTNASAAGGLPTFTSAPEDWKPSTEPKGNGGPGEEAGGKKGGRPLDAGTSGAKGGDPGAGAGGAGGAAGPQINNGFRGGGGSSSGSSWNGGTTGATGQGGAGAAAGTTAAGGPDLRQFLPGGKFDPGARGVAGLTGPDGITGPHDDVWRKIKNRYQAKTPTFLGQ